MRKCNHPAYVNVSFHTQPILSLPPEGVSQVMHICLKYSLSLPMQFCLYFRVIELGLNVSLSKNIGWLHNMICCSTSNVAIKNRTFVASKPICLSSYFSMPHLTTKIQARKKLGSFCFTSLPFLNSSLQQFEGYGHSMFTFTPFLKAKNTVDNKLHHT